MSYHLNFHMRQLAFPLLWAHVSGCHPKCRCSWSSRSTPRRWMWTSCERQVFSFVQGFHFDVEDKMNIRRVSIGQHFLLVCMVCNRNSQLSSLFCLHPWSYFLLVWSWKAPPYRLQLFCLSQVLVLSPKAHHILQVTKVAKPFNLSSSCVERSHGWLNSTLASAPPCCLKRIQCYTLHILQRHCIYCLCCLAQ